MQPSHFKKTSHLWMILLVYIVNFHPEIGDEKHPFLGDTLSIRFLSKTDDEKHPF